MLQIERQKQEKQERQNLIQKEIETAKKKEKEAKEKKSKEAKEQAKKKDEKKEKEKEKEKETNGKEQLEREDKRKRDESGGIHQTQKKNKTTKEDNREKREEFEWHSEENEKLTIRIADKEMKRKLDQDDFRYIQRMHVEAYTLHDDDDIGEKVNIEHGGFDGIAIRCKMSQKEGVKWMAELIPKIVPLSGRAGYQFFPPGQRITTQYRVLVSDPLAGGTPERVELFKKSIWKANKWTREPGMFQWTYRGSDKKTQGTIWTLEVDKNMNEKIKERKLKLSYGVGPLSLKEIKPKELIRPTNKKPQKGEKPKNPAENVESEEEDMEDMEAGEKWERQLESQWEEEKRGMELKKTTTSKLKK